MNDRDVQRLESLLDQLDIPESRKTVNETNILWLFRNGWVENSEKKQILDEAMMLAKMFIRDSK